jgi:hypothetical protein
MMKRLSLGLAVLLVGVLSSFAQYGGNRWEILRAEYGTGSRWVDVTSRVQSLVRGDSLNFRAGNDALGLDPVPEHVKALRLQVRDQRGRTKQLTFREGETVNLLVIRGNHPGGGGWDRLQINRAQYGSGNRTMDVTGRLMAQVQNNQVSLRVGNDSMGGDPAEGRHKALTVWYTYNGRQQQVTVNEGDYLNLPGVSGGGGYPGSGGGLLILRADYGAEHRHADVTARLQSQVQGDRLSLRVTNDTMGRDPAEDHRKVLMVWYSLNGRSARVTVNEGESLNLPGNDDWYQGGLQITRAQYGADYRYRDVTDRLNSQMQGDRLNLRVTNDSMGGDPAEDRRKTLTVLYIYNGRQGRTVVTEGDTLNLPGNDENNWPSGGSWGQLQILQASYGAGDRRMDVTSRVASQLSGDRFEMRVSNDTMGGDPAAGQPKRLRVIYLWQGLRYETSVPEGGTLDLP